MSTLESPGGCSEIETRGSCSLSLSSAVTSERNTSPTTSSPTTSSPPPPPLRRLAQSLSLSDRRPAFFRRHRPQPSETSVRSLSCLEEKLSPPRPARHVPIVITQGLIASVLKDWPDSPELLDLDLEPQGPQQPELDELRQHIAFFHKTPAKPRHIPIVIPDWAQPHAPYTSTPSPSSSEESTPRASFSPISSAPESPQKMSRAAVGAGISRPSTAGSTQSPNGLRDPNASFSSAYNSQMSSSQSSLNQDQELEPDVAERIRSSESTPHANSFPHLHAGAAAAANIPHTASHQQPQQQPQAQGSANLSGLVCNVHRCTGREPHALVGATTTILGDKLYVFGGKRLSRRRPILTSDLYELDLLKRHWTRLHTFGQIPPPRYFHSVCALGDNKLICYGGMSPAPAQSPPPQGGQPAEQPAEVIVMSDIHVYDVPSRSWTRITTNDNPQGRYAHCATVLPSSAVFASANAPRSAIQNNPSSDEPNSGTIGVSLDGSGGAEMVVVGGQDSANGYIEEISVFNLRSLRWTSTTGLGKSCGAYRSVVSPLTGLPASKVGNPAHANESKEEIGRSRNNLPGTTSMLIYSNYNFLDVKLELQIRAPDGSLTEKAMSSQFSPPGLRFPNGGVLDNHFVVSGTYLTSTHREYALWALDLRTLTWSRIDTGGGVFGQGSWNRGVLWPRRNAFVILGNRKRSLVEDYNHRRINFTNVCMVELEAFGLYDNPRHAAPASGFVSASAPAVLQMPGGAPRPPRASPRWGSGGGGGGGGGGGRLLVPAAEELGQKLLGMREFADMDILGINGERIPVNSHVLARRWGAYFVNLMREGATAPGSINGGNGGAGGSGGGGTGPGGGGVGGGGGGNSNGGAFDNADTATLRAPTSGSSGGNSAASRNSSITITPSVANSAYTGSTLTPTSSLSGTSTSSSAATSLSSGTNGAGNGLGHDPDATYNLAGAGDASTSNAHPFHPPNSLNLPPPTRSRTLYLPHTPLTIHALLHFLHTSALPPATHHALCTPQILCSLLQIARPYCVEGLLEAVVERLHQVMDGRNAAAVFNASAMAAGGGRAVAGRIGAVVVGAGEEAEGQRGGGGGDRDERVGENGGAGGAGGAGFRRGRDEAPEEMLLSPSSSFSSMGAGGGGGGAADDFEGYRNGASRQQNGQSQPHQQQPHQQRPGPARSFSSNAVMGTGMGTGGGNRARDGSAAPAPGGGRGVDDSEDDMSGTEGRHPAGAAAHVAAHISAPVVGGGGGSSGRGNNGSNNGSNNNNNNNDSVALAMAVLSGAEEDEEEVWSAERSCVVGLQKRGLRGLIEGRKMRESGRRGTNTGATPAAGGSGPMMGGSMGQGQEVMA